MKEEFSKDWRTNINELDEVFNEEVKDVNTVEKTEDKTEPMVEIVPETTDEEVLETKEKSETNQDLTTNDTNIILSKIETLMQSNQDNKEVLEKLDTIIDLLKKDEEIIEPEKIEEDNSLQTVLDDILKKEERNNNLLVQYLKENVEFQQQVRINMNKENELLKKELLGERMDPLLKEFATIYCEYCDLMNVEFEDKNVTKKIQYLFESIEEVLTDNGCEFNTTNAGEERSPKTTKIRKPIVPTMDKELHRTVIKSFNPSITKGNKLLYPEYVRVYSYDENLTQMIPFTESDDKNREVVTQDESQVLKETELKKEADLVIEETKICENETIKQESEVIESSKGEN